MCTSHFVTMWSQKRWSQSEMSAGSRIPTYMYRSIPYKPKTGAEILDFCKMRREVAWWSALLCRVRKLPLWLFFVFGLKCSWKCYIGQQEVARRWLNWPLFGVFRYMFHPTWLKHIDSGQHRKIGNWKKKFSFFHRKKEHVDQFWQKLVTL